MKKSRIVISKPSHNFLIVDTVGFLVMPLTISLTVDWVTPEISLALLIVMFLSSHN